MSFLRAVTFQLLICSETLVNSVSKERAEKRVILNEVKDLVESEQTVRSQSYGCPKYSERKISIAQVHMYRGYYAHIVLATKSILNKYVSV